ncbi:MAG TPA: PAS domain-containing protein [Opitutaceae bacterium]
MDPKETRNSNSSLCLVASRPELAREALADHIIIRANRMAAALVESSQSPRVIVNESGNVVYANDMFLRFFQTVTIDKVYHLQVRIGPKSSSHSKNPRTPARTRRRRNVWGFSKSRPDLLELRDQNTRPKLEFTCGECIGIGCHQYVVCSMPLRMSDRTFALLQLETDAGS